MSPTVNYQELLALKTLLEACRKVLRCVHCVEDFGPCGDCRERLEQAVARAERVEA